MEQDVETTYRNVCITCLSSDRVLYQISCYPGLLQIYNFLMCDFAGERFADIEGVSPTGQLICWECLALMKRFMKFRQQVHNAHAHLRVLAMSHVQETLDHTYMSESLSSLTSNIRSDYDKVFVDYSTEASVWDTPFVLQAEETVKDEHMLMVTSGNMTLDAGLDMDEHILNDVPEIVLENPVTGIMSRIMVPSVSNMRDAILMPNMSDGTATLELTVSPINSKIDTQIAITKVEKDKENDDKKAGYIKEFMNDETMMACREEMKQRPQYASALFKCELCVVGFYTQQQVEDHFMNMHQSKPGRVACRVCYAYIEERKLQRHLDNHYVRYLCVLCGACEQSPLGISAHVKTHISTEKKQPGRLLIGGETKKKKGKPKSKDEPKPGDLRKLLSKTVIEGYQCLECDGFFKTTRARKAHVARVHREGFQCDVCQKRFVNKTTLTTHLKLHEGPLPREECPICHKMVRSIQIKYHIQRHENKTRYACNECKKIFSHLSTYQAHLKYSRAHATDEVFKFPCPMCNKGYPTKEQMQDHFNYQHLGKTSHKCPVCDKPISSRANVEKHMIRVHGQKKEKPRNHICQQCGKGFTDRKSLSQHEVIHSGARPLSCNICQQTFKQKASLYTHRKRVHKVFPVKKSLEYMEDEARI